MLRNWLRTYDLDNLPRSTRQVVTAGAEGPARSVSRLRLVLGFTDGLYRSGAEIQIVGHYLYLLSVFALGIRQTD